MRKTALSALTLVFAFGGAITSTGAQLELAVDKREYLAGEPFVVTARLLNREGNLMILSRSFSYAKFLQLHYRTKGADQWMPHVASMLANEEIGTALVRAEPEIAVSRVFAGFAEPGTVDLQLRYYPQGGPEELNSPVVPVRVIAASPRDTEAARRWLDDDIQMAVQFPEAESLVREARPKMTAIMTEFQDSVYADFARRALQRSEPTVAEVGEVNSGSTQSIATGEHANASPTPAEVDAAPERTHGQAYDRMWTYAVGLGILLVVAVAVWFRLRKVGTIGSGG